ncbi:ArsR/SmtB family transcription factor [Salinibacillus xinjiangensis]|uniref:Metalloregulator ArsR/SmtB family transcription factor n=1 Tax=Salinibacillus xinjiangensis TaxID=1229268 RepID=A0A6G1X8H3_9BACI|nr:metalloregulator ArsR/SmtB family transcription factor [Salinibacillus xinjiangensis]MRG87242.1 metalloregulator ArsR/SmtB family transcription factor [Salinibacillus xinjiangensis]
MKAKDVCDVSCINENVVNRVQPEVAAQPIDSVSNLFKAFSDETRLRIAYALSIEEELCVCDVANIVGSSNATASHHLRQLRKNGLAKYRKQGKLAYYSLDDQHVKQMIDLAFTHYKEVNHRG